MLRVEPDIVDALAEAVGLPLPELVVAALRVMEGERREERSELHRAEVVEADVRRELGSGLYRVDDGVKLIASRADALTGPGLAAHVVALPAGERSVIVGGVLRHWLSLAVALLRDLPVLSLLPDVEGIVGGLGGVQNQPDLALGPRVFGEGAPEVDAPAEALLL